MYQLNILKYLIKRNIERLIDKKYKIAFLDIPIGLYNISNNILIHKTIGEIISVEK
jgi:hypothetical protein